MNARTILSTAALSALVLLSACSKSADTTAATTPAAQQKMRDAPDFGGVTKQYVEADGVGASRAAAIDDALRMAIKQVNGVSIDASEAQVHFATAITTSMGDASIDSAAFAQAVATNSKGLVSDFKIVSEKEEKPSLLKNVTGKGPNGSWRVRVGANITKYRASADANRPRVVVAPARSGTGNYAFGDGGRRAEEISAAIQSRLNDAISQTNRFTVMDRQATDEIQSEVDLINSGAVNQKDTVRLGQQLAADLIVIPTIQRMEYTRHAQQLRLADRELVSYSGGARISFKVVNATTGQLVMSDTFATEFPTTRPTTLGASVDVKGATDRALNDMTAKFIAELLQKTFPVSVIALNGSDVVLSQGGAAVKVGDTYRAVLLGAALTDPQTGQSLGRSESDFGTVVVTRSEPNVSYGTLQGGRALPGAFQPGMIELRGAVAGAPAPAPMQTAAVAPGAARPAAAPRRSSGPALAGEAAPAPAKVDKDW